MGKPLRKTHFLSSMLLMGLPLLTGPLQAATTTINLNHASLSVLKSLQSSAFANTQLLNSFEEIKRSVDKKNTLHIRVQQKYLGHIVRGGEFIIHQPNTISASRDVSLKSIIHHANRQDSMTGKIYQHLDRDLTASVPPGQQAQRAFTEVFNLSINDYAVNKQIAIKEKKTDLIVYIDKNHKAHWTYKISFLQIPADESLTPIRPTYLIDATNFTVYAKWNDIKNLEQVSIENAFGGGVGGNKKIGKLTYDGLPGNLSKLTVDYDASAKSCYWKNADVLVQSYRPAKVMTFSCKKLDPQHNNIYWVGVEDAVNGGYGPSHDALFTGGIIKAMYLEWYNLPVLTNDDGSPMLLTMVVHKPKYDNAYWDGSTMTFGDGKTIFYPLASLGVGSHEISHGFTQQHSNLEYWGQSGGINEAFSDMAALAAEYYVYGKNTWQIGWEIFKAENAALRYVDQPSKDCPPGNEPGEDCSIDDATQYNDSLDVHYSSGVFNRLFYLLSTSTGWNTKKAFDVMVQANRFYWFDDTDFVEGACGILKATEQLGYEVNAVKSAINQVRIDISNC